MGHPRRKYKNRKAYLISNRLAHGLPFVPNIYINALLYGALARASSRNRGVVLCAFEFLQNHYHLIVYLEGDAEEMSSFLHDLDDELARIVKKLLGKSNLKVWAQRPHVALLGDAAAVIKELAYCFMNAVQAQFCDKAAHWIGIHSFLSLFSEKQEEHKWVKTRKLNRLPNRDFTKRHIKHHMNTWIEAPGPTFALRIKPYIWKHLFKETRNLTNEQIRELILSEISDGEARCRQERKKNRSTVADPHALAMQNPHKPYTPKKRGRRVYCICTDPELRKEIIAAYKAFCETCAAVWASWRKGDFSAKYPPGAFIPPRPPLASAVFTFP